jgi:hypothetical protein
LLPSQSFFHYLFSSSILQVTTAMSDRPFTVIAVPATVLARCCRMRGWDEPKCLAVQAAYRQFMVLKVKHKDWSATILSPPEEIDFMWHQHILDVENYIHACWEYCGHLIGHDPDGALDRVARQKRIVQQPER